MRHREREHRAERVQVAEQRRLAGEQEQRGEEAEERDREPRRAVLAVQAGEDLGQLAVLGQRPRQAADADQPGVGGDEEDRRGQDADVCAHEVQQPAAEAEGRDDAEDGIVRVLAAERGGAVDDGQRGERDDRDARIDAEDREEHHVDRLGHVAPGVLRLLGHVRDLLDAGVGDHRDREREDELRPRGRRTQVHLVHEQRGIEHEHGADDDEQHLRGQVDDGEDEVELGRLAQPADVQRREQGDGDDPADDVAGVVVERGPERAEVVRHEERADGDRDDVVERQRPAGDERRELVERVARERARAARLGEHGRALGVRLGGEGEQAAGEHEDHRREAQRVRGDQAEGVVDRRPDVAVRGREQPRDPDGPPQAVLLQARHASRVRPRVSSPRRDFAPRR